MKNISYDKSQITKEHIQRLLNGEEKVLVYNDKIKRIYISKSKDSTLVLEGYIFDDKIYIKNDLNIFLNPDTIDNLMNNFQEIFMDVIDANQCLLKMLNVDMTALWHELPDFDDDEQEERG